MRQGIDIATQDPILVDLFGRLKGTKDTADEKMKFVIKQAETVAKAYEKDAMEVWKQIEEHLIAKGKLPKTYDKEKTLLQYDKDTGLIVSIDKSDLNDGSSGFKDFLRHLLHH